MVGIGCVVKWLRFAAIPGTAISAVGDKKFCDWPAKGCGRHVEAGIAGIHVVPDVVEEER